MMTSPVYQSILDQITAFGFPAFVISLVASEYLGHFRLTSGFLRVRRLWHPVIPGIRQLFHEFLARGDYSGAAAAILIHRLTVRPIGAVQALLHGPFCRPPE